MGMMAKMGAVATLGRAAQSLTEVLVPNRTEGQALNHEAHRAALAQLEAEFALERRGRFDRFVDGLNRLPRPLLALGTLGMFVYAMAEPLPFAARMQGLELVPDPLWWLLGAIVGFYFGARELHYVRAGRVARAVLPEPNSSAWHVEDGNAAERNAALDEWRAGDG
ncbi:holin family protein [Jannaschia ovalis]